MRGIFAKDLKKIKIKRYFSLSINRNTKVAMKPEQMITISVNNREEDRQNNFNSYYYHTQKYVATKKY